MFKDVPGLPPDQEIEFTTDLVIRTAPMSKDPYQMASIKLAGLKVQLQELLDKGLIQPSVSLCGASVLFIKKNDETLSICIDCKELNKVTI